MNSLRTRCSTNVPGLADLLRAHPCVDFDPHVTSHAIAFEQGHWSRYIEVGENAELRGLVELVDNNPMVCATSFSVPDPGTTLALIALGPLARAGLIVERPSILAAFPVDEPAVTAFLSDLGWPEGAACHCIEQQPGSVLALNAMCLIATPSEMSDIDAVYDEAYSRSFYVRRSDEGEWDLDLVEGHPWAAYRLRVTEGEPHSLLTIQTMSDRYGKAGAAQLVHALNVMAGFEECLGIT